MKLSPQTLEVINSFSKINQAVLFRKGSTLSTISPGRTVVAYAKLDQEFDHDFGIFELRKFMGVLKLFKDPEIETSQNVIWIRSENKSVKYVCADPRTFMVAPDESKIEIGNVEVQFTLEPEALASVRKAIGILDYKHLAFVGRDGKLFVQAVSITNPNGDVYSVEIGETNRNFTVIMSNDRLDLIPGKYEVKITEDCTVIFSSDQATYYIPALDEDSTID